jgi:uncharacterized protein YndB with AHSA1/START domain
MNRWDEDPSVYSGTFEVEITIDRPVAEVWRQYVDAASWISTHEIEFVTGAPGIEGSIRRIAFRKAKELGMAPPHHHYGKLIKVIPERQQLVKTYAEKEGAYGMQMLCFDDARFESVGGGTRVIFNTFAEIKSADVAKDPAAYSLDASRNGMLANLTNLKRMLEGHS